MNLHTLNSLNAEDRDNLADILWWIKGYNHSDKSPFCEDHEKTLEHVISAIRNKINDEKYDKARTEGSSKS